MSRIPPCNGASRSGTVLMTSRSSTHQKMPIFGLTLAASFFFGAMFASPKRCKQRALKLRFEAVQVFDAQTLSGGVVTLAPRRVLGLGTSVWELPINQVCIARRPALSALARDGSQTPGLTGPNYALYNCKTFSGELDVITREELYELVWSKPMTQVAEQFDVSGSYLARVCSVLRVPRPARGYWAKLAVGRAPKPMPLPAAQPGDQVVWSKDGELHARPVPLITASINPRKSRLIRRVSGTHGLIIGAKNYFETGHPIEDEKYLKPYKRLLVDINASKAGLDKALAFANQLFNALESAGHRVVIAPHCEQLRCCQVDEHETPKKKQEYYYRNLWSPCRPTVVYVGTVAIGLAVVEMSEEVLMRHVNGKYIRDAEYVPPKASRYHVDHTWTTTKEMPCGRLRLIAYSPYGSVSWSTNWQETKTTSLTREIPAIVKAIKIAANDLIEKLKEAERQAGIRRLEWEAAAERHRQEEDHRRVQQSIQDSQDQLRQIIQAWGNVMNVERFLQGVQERASDLPTGERDAVLDRLKLAREFIGTQNPLDFFRSWKTPIERYKPLSARAENNKDIDDEDESNDDEST